MTVERVAAWACIIGTIGASFIKFGRVDEFVDTTREQVRVLSANQGEMLRDNRMLERVHAMERALDVLTQEVKQLRGELERKRK